ncbi:hypothetical protein FNH09_33060 [Streptomyces adustus]|uniref:Uncharacterized protein n=1 Tax=Streptomyces adustus TaxID=1609272 RepID=A0A5N8VKV5_9ACTN|nr:hypothetical protein [Streptomyces adustus]MPY35890.1 hypothetical protein [Streptomyces adustus]
MRHDDDHHNVGGRGLADVVKDHGDGEAAVRALEAVGVDPACWGDLIGFLVWAFDLGPAPTAAEGGTRPQDHADGSRESVRRPTGEA